MKLSLQISEILNRIVASNSNLSDRRRGRNPRVQMAVQAVVNIGRGWTQGANQTLSGVASYVPNAGNPVTGFWRR